MRALIRRMLPKPVLRLLGGVIVRRRERRLAALPIDQAFDEVYRLKLWKQGESLSGVGSEGKWANDYIALVRDYIASNDCRTVLDIGCGDFAVGSRIAPHVDRYLAFDISKRIIGINRAKYADMSNVTFEALDVTDAVLPRADLVLVRQVLQHLSNAQIEAALANIEKSGARCVLVAEHTMRPELMDRANLDLQSHTVATRVQQGSGVDIGKPPFSRARKVVAVLEPGVENQAERQSVLCVYEMTAA